MIDDIFVEPDPRTFYRLMESFSDELQNKAMTSGLSAAAAPVKKRMRLLAPERKKPSGGALKKSISHKQLSRTEKVIMGVPIGKRGILVGPIKKVVDKNYARDPARKIGQGYKAFWLEFTGASRHPIPFNRIGTGKYRQKVLRFTGGDGKLAPEVMHPGFRKKKFIGPALDSTGSQVETSFYSGMSKRLDKLERK